MTMAVVANMLPDLICYCEMFRVLFCTLYSHQTRLSLSPPAGAAWEEELCSMSEVVSYHQIRSASTSPSPPTLDHIQGIERSQQ